MEELIRRSDAIKAIKDHSFALGDDYMEINGYGAIDDIRALPSADRPQGKWEIYVISPFDGEDCRCSNCGKTGCAPYWNFCPNCGCRMKGADDETD